LAAPQLEGCAGSLVGCAWSMDGSHTTVVVQRDIDRLPSNPGEETAV